MSDLLGFEMPGTEALVHENVVPKVKLAGVYSNISPEHISAGVSGLVNVGAAIIAIVKLLVPPSPQAFLPKTLKGPPPIDAANVIVGLDVETVVKSGNVHS